MAGPDLEWPQRLLARSPPYRRAWRIGGYGYGRAGPLLLGGGRTAQTYWLATLTMWNWRLGKPSGTELFTGSGSWRWDTDGRMAGGSVDQEGRLDWGPMTATQAGGGHQSRLGWHVQPVAVPIRRLIMEFVNLELVRAQFGMRP